MANKKKIVTLSISSILLVAMVVALTIGTREDEKGDEQDISSSSKAIQTICGSTDYQQTCVDTLKSSDRETDDPKELIEIAFEATIKYVEDAAKNSTVIQELQTDPRAKAALDNCHELANRAVNDLRRSYNKFKEFDVASFNAMLSDLKIWLSGAITYQETCLDGFEDVPGDAEEKMREALTKAMQLSSNGLAMVTEISSVLESLGVQGFNNRRLLSQEVPALGEMPDWVDPERRQLLHSKKVKPNLIVAKDGSGKFTTINEALRAIPKNGNQTFVLYIKEGVYEEKVQFNSSMTHLFVIGDGPTKTKITGHLNFIDGTNTYQTATVAVQADNFMAKDIGFENSAGAAKHQAVALRVSADKTIFYNCQMDGYQDTLYAHTYRQFYRDCVISGTIDFIFGDSAAVFQGCTMVIRKPMDNQQNIVTAQGRKEVRQPTGIVIQNCTLTADPEYYPVRNTIKSYLGRPWKEYSRTIIMESYLDDCIQPQGWLPWNETFALETLFYAEFNNRGPGAPKADRIKWPGVKELPATRVERFTAAEFIGGDVWIPPTGVPYAPGFIFSVPKEDPNVNYSPVVPEENKDLGKKDLKEAYIPSDKKDKDSEKKKDDDKDEEKKKDEDKKDDNDKDEDKKDDDNDKDSDENNGKDNDSDKKDNGNDNDSDNKDNGDDNYSEKKRDDSDEISSDEPKPVSGFDFVIDESPSPSPAGVFDDSYGAVPSSISLSPDQSPHADAPALGPTSQSDQEKKSMINKFFGWN